MLESTQMEQSNSMELGPGEVQPQAVHFLTVPPGEVVQLASLPAVRSVPYFVLPK